MQTIQQREQHQDRDANRSLDTRLKSEDILSMSAEALSLSINRAVVPDLRRDCPVCGKPYQPAEEVLALASLSFATGAVSGSAASAGGDPCSMIFLGHQRCVLPRLLTLLAGFQPEARWVKASKDFFAGESAGQERHHAEA